MPSHPTMANMTPKLPLFIFPVIFIFFLLILSQGAAENVNKDINIGAIVNINSRIGKEVETAIKVAAQNFNTNLKNYKLFVHFRSSGTDPLQASYAAVELIKKKNVQVIMGMETWQEAAMVADVGNRAEVPILSLASGAITSSSAALRWPFLVRMGNKGTREQIACIAAIVNSFQCPGVIAIYEEDPYGGDFGMSALLSTALQNVGSKIEYSLVFPPLSSLSDPDGYLRQKLVKLLSKQSRVFIILGSSLPLAISLFKEAKHMGLTGRDSKWVISNTIADLLDSVDYSDISFMKGALGIKTYYSEDTKSFQEFCVQFHKIFRKEYPDENNSYPGIHAIRAYDSITTIIQAMERTTTTHYASVSSRMLLKNILSSNFTGLTGEIRFKGRELSHLTTYRIVDIIGKRYGELDFWSKKFGFSESPVVENGGGVSRKMLAGSTNWQGNPKRVLNDHMVIGVPGNTSFEKFVKVDPNGSSDKKYFGFCIDLFHDVLEILEEENYTLTYEFVPFYGTYENLVDQVYDKTFDAVVGDMTILANRSKYVDFTQPFAESGLTMIVPVTSKEKAWMFMKPFTMEMWVVTGAILIYTMFIVWFLEHPTNPAFQGPWKDQLGTSLWFTFSTLFFAHREKVQSNFTRVVIVVWLFVVLVLTSSYTASLTSMLTVPRLQPNVTDIAWLQKTNSKVGCDGDSFVRRYLEDVLEFSSSNIMNISSQYDYPDEFKSGNIKAAFLEVPYEKVFLNQYCKGYTVTGPIFRFGGLGFVFPKGSPLVDDVSRAILTLSENGKLKELEGKWFSPSPECLSPTSTSETESLSLQSFWGVYLISGATSTICFILVFIRLLRHYQHDYQEEGRENVNISDKHSVWNKTIRLARYFHNGELRSPVRAPTFAHTPNVDEWGSSKWVYVSPTDGLEDLQASRPAEVEML